MATQDVFRFRIEASNQQSKDSFDELKDKAEEVERAIQSMTSVKGNNLEKEFSEIVRTLAEVNKEYTILKRNINDNLVARRSSSHARTSVGRGEIDRLEKEQKQLDRAMVDFRSQVDRRGAGQYQQRTQRRARFSTAPGIYNPNFNDQYERIGVHQNMQRVLQSQTREAEAISGRAVKAGYIPAGSAARFRDIHTRLTHPEQMQGFFRSEMDEGPVDNAQARMGSFRRQAVEDISQSQTRISDIMGQISALQEDRDNNLIEVEQFDQTMRELQAELKQTEQVVTEAKKSIAALDEASKRLKDTTNELDHAQVKEKAKEGSFSRQMQERSFSIGLAAVAAGLYSLKSTLDRGQQNARTMREPSMNLGMVSGNYDFRGMREEHMRAGAPLGWSGPEMLGFAEAVMGNLGYRDSNTQTDMTENMAEFSRFSGAGTDASVSYMESLLSSGAVSNADQARAIQEGFVGAIKQSGMEGREREQLEALTAINASISQGRELTNEELRSRQAVTNALSATGNRALQGANMAGFMQSADSAIRNADPFGNIGMLLGSGSDPAYSGANWRYNQLDMLENGLDTENFNTIFENFRNMYGDNMEAIAAEFVDTLGLDTSVSAIRELLEANPGGIQAGSEAEEALRNLEGIGQDAMAERNQAFEESSDSTVMANDAMKQLRETIAGDNGLIDAVNSAKLKLNEFGTNSTGGAMGMTGAIALGTSISTIIGSLGSSVIGQLVKKLTGGTFLTGGLETWAGNGSKLATAGGWIKSAGSTAVSKGASMLGLGGGKALLSTAGKGASMLGLGKALLSTAGKAAPWLAVANGVYQTATAEDKVGEGIEQTGKVGGMFAGMKAGGVLGATLGSVVPVLGTAVGGAIGVGLGGIGGYFAGGKLGGWVNDTFRGGKGNEPEPEVTVKSAYQEFQDTQTPEEVANTNAKMLAEQLRSDNISRETELIDRFTSLLREARGIVEQAMTLGTNLIGGGSGSGGVRGANGVVGSGQYWSNTNLTQHDLGQTSSGLTARELDSWINANAPQNSVMRGMGATFMKAGEESGLDPRYLVAHSALETGWGTSKIARDKGNMFGIGAFDASPYASAYGYNGTQAGIIEGAKWIRENYYDRGETTLTDMNRRYATDPQWASKIAATMGGAERHTSPSIEVNINGLNYNGTGNPEADGRNIARGVGNQINQEFRYERLM